MGGMVALNKKTVVSFCLLISKISLPVHNFGIKMLLTSLAGSATLGDTSGARLTTELIGCLELRVNGQIFKLWRAGHCSFQLRISRQF